MFNKRRSSSGFSLIELLVALSIFATLLAISFPALHTAIKTSKQLEGIAESQIASNYLFSQIERIVQQQDKLLAQEVAFVASKSILPARLNSRSDVLVLIDASLQSALARNKVGSETKFCSLFELTSQERTRVENSKFFLLQAVDDVLITASAISKSKSPLCREYLLSNSENSLNTPDLKYFKIGYIDQLNKALIAIPIKDIFGYYLDESQTLRRYSFISGQSQPFIQGVSNFDLASSSQIAGEVIDVELEIKKRSSSRSFFIQKGTQFAYLNLFFF